MEVGRKDQEPQFSHPSLMIHLKSEAEGYICLEAVQKLSCRFCIGHTRLFPSLDLRL